MVIICLLDKARLHGRRLSWSKTGVAQRQIPFLMPCPFTLEKRSHTWLQALCANAQITHLILCCFELCNRWRQEAFQQEAFQHNAESRSCCCLQHC